MKKTTTIILLILVSVSLSYGQVKIRDLVTKDDATSFNSDAFNEVITRQNSSSFFLKDFIFSQSKEGKFLVDLQIKLNTYDINTSSPGKVRTLRMLFQDVIEVKEKDKPIKLSLSNSKLADNIILTDVTDIDVDVRLVPVKEDFTSSFNLIKPLLNTVVKGAEPAFQVIDNFIQIARKGDDKSPLLFHTNITVSQNIFEYNKLKSDSTLNLLENNSTLGIVLNGQNDVAFDGSVAGEAASFVNGVAKFVMGKTVISKGKLKYDGLLSLYFTKDINPLLPPFLFKELNGINDIQNEVDIDNAHQEYDVEMKKVGTMVTNTRNDEKINNQTAYSILVYLRLGEIIMDYKITSLKGDKNDLWIREFKTLDNDINFVGAANGVQAVGVTDIYDANKIAKIYIPYSLSDDLTLSFYSWQILLHKLLYDAKDQTLAKTKPTDAQIKAVK